MDGYDVEFWTLAKYLILFIETFMELMQQLDTIYRRLHCIAKFYAVFRAAPEAALCDCGKLIIFCCG